MYSIDWNFVLCITQKACSQKTRLLLYALCISQCFWKWLRPMHLWIWVLHLDVVIDSLVLTYRILQPNRSRSLNQMGRVCLQDLLCSFSLPSLSSKHKATEQAILYKFWYYLISIIHEKINTRFVVYTNKACDNSGYLLKGWLLQRFSKHHRSYQYTVIGN